MVCITMASARACVYDGNQITGDPRRHQKDSFGDLMGDRSVGLVCPVLAVGSPFSLTRDCLYTFSLSDTLLLHASCVQPFGRDGESIENINTACSRLSWFSSNPAKASE